MELLHTNSEAPRAKGRRTAAAVGLVLGEGCLEKHPPTPKKKNQNPQQVHRLPTVQNLLLSAAPQVFLEDRPRGSACGFFVACVPQQKRSMPPSGMAFWGAGWLVAVLGGLKGGGCCARVFFDVFVGGCFLA